MSVAFRIRTQAGQELSFASREAFEDFVRSGDMSLDDLVYDAETGSWSSALTHPMVLEIQYAAEEAAEAEAAEVAAQEAKADAAADEVAPRDEDEDEDVDEDLGLSLAPAQDVEPKSLDGVEDPSVPEIERAVMMPEDPVEVVADSADEGESSLELAPEQEQDAEEAKRAFVAKMESERASSFDFGADAASLGSVTMENRGSMADMITAAPTPEPEVERPKPKAKPRRPRPTPEKKSGGLGKLVAGFVILAAVGGGGFFAFQSMGADEAPAPDETVELPTDPVEVEPEPDPLPEPTIATTEAAVLERAQERYLTASQDVFTPLQPIPESWATAEYFANPSAYADVVGIWEGYLVAIRNAREGDRRRYTTAFEAALDDAVIQGEDRTERSGRAMAAFDMAASAREAHFGRVEALASAAIQSHNALVGVEGLILIDPSGPIGIQSGIGRGAYGRDEDSQLLLDQVVEVLNGTLDAEGAGPDEGPNVREWVWGGFLDAVTSGS